MRRLDAAVAVQACPSPDARPPIHSGAEPPHATARPVTTPMGIPLECEVLTVPHPEKYAIDQPIGDQGDHQDVAD